MLKNALLALLLTLPVVLAGGGDAPVLKWQGLELHATNVIRFGTLDSRLDLFNPRGQLLATLTQHFTGYDLKDWTGDGIPELELTGHTGGMHCCVVSAVLERTKTGARNLFTYYIGNYGNLEPKQLDADKPLELVGQSDVLAYFNGSYYDSPTVGVVFDRVGSTYKLASRKFPKVLIAKAQESWQMYLKHDPAYSKRDIIQYLANMTEAGQGAATLEKILNDPRVTQSDKDWARDHAKKLNKALANLPNYLWQLRQKPLRFNDKNIFPKGW